MRYARRVVASALMILGATYAQASTIQLTPGSQTASNRQLVTTDIVASGFSSGGAPSIGAYDLSVSFDPTVLSFISASFGSGLDVLGLGDIQSVTPGSGTVELFELSFDSIADLNSLQPDTFALAELNFRAVGTGISPLVLSANAVSDANGNDLPVSLQGSTVQIGTQTPPAVTPEPPSMLLCATGLLIILTAAVRNKDSLPTRRSIRA